MKGMQMPGHGYGRYENGNASCEQDVAVTLLALQGQGVGALGRHQHQHIPSLHSQIGGLLPNGDVLNAGVEGNGHRGGKVQCLCYSALWRDKKMLCCKDPLCGIWQHQDCAIPSYMAPPRDFFCEKCRSARADPFWEDMNVDILHPCKLRFQGRQMQVGHSLQQVQVQERAFNMRVEEIMKARSKGFKVQVVCLLLGDEIPFRYNWPKSCRLKVNSTQYRVYGRSTSNKLGDNQRDEPANISTLVRNGKNQIQIECADSRPFCFFIQLVQQRSHDEVKALMRPPETLEAALKRVIRQVRGGTYIDDPPSLAEVKDSTTSSQKTQLENTIKRIIQGSTKPRNNADDDDVIMTSVVVSLKCPLSAQRIQTPCRFMDVDMLDAVFDLDSFLASVERTRKWACPHSLKGSCVQMLCQDVYLEKVLECVQGVPDLMEIEVSPEGKWRPKGMEDNWRSIFEDAQEAAVVVGRATVKNEEGLSSDFSDDEDEVEEMRKAAAAMMQQVQNRRKEDAVTGKVEIIDLLSDDTDNDDLLMSTTGRDNVAPPQNAHRTGHQANANDRQGVGTSMRRDGEDVVMGEGGRKRRLGAPDPHSRHQDWVLTNNVPGRGIQGRGGHHRQNNTEGFPGGLNGTSMSRFRQYVSSGHAFGPPPQPQPQAPLKGPWEVPDLSSVVRGQQQYPVATSWPPNLPPSIPDSHHSWSDRMFVMPRMESNVVTTGMGRAGQQNGGVPGLSKPIGGVGGQGVTLQACDILSFDGCDEVIELDLDDD